MVTVRAIDKRRAVRGGVALAICSAAALAAGVPAFAGFPGLDLQTAASFVVGLLFGWAAVAGAGLGVFLGTVLRSGVDSGIGPAAAAGLAAAVAAAVPYSLFRKVPRLGRGLPSLRSYAWLLGAGALAAVPAALLRHGLPHGLADGAAPLEVWSGAFSGLAAIAFAAPPALLAVDLWGRWSRAPIPGEEPARRSLSVAETARLTRASAAQETRVVTPPSARLGWGFAAMLATVLGVTAVAVPVTAVVADGGYWILLVYLGPILWAGSRLGLRGAVITSSAAALAFLAGHGAWRVLVDAPSLQISDADLLAAHAELVLFGLVGALAGTGQERERILRAEVAHRNRLLRQDLLRVVQALTSAVEVKDVYTEGHLKRVSDYAMLVGESLDLSGHELEMLFFASMLHDIGKLGVPESVLAKAGGLNLEEARVMRRHPEIGARILQDLDVLRDAAPLVLHHQERWDGRRDGKYPGYPAGLAGDAIPMGSRIIAVVDAFDAMTTDRPYRKALSPADAVAELRREAGKQFDPRVVEVFVEVLGEHPWKVQEVA